MIEDLLEEEYRGISKKSTEEGTTEEGIDYQGRNRLQESKSSTEAKDYKNTTRRLLIQSIGESPLFDCWIEEY